METSLNSIKPYYWFVEDIRYADFELEIYISEGITAKEPDAESTVPGARLVEAKPESKRYKIYFEDVISFHVTDESVAMPDKKAIGAEGVLRIFEKSTFLEYVESTCNIWVSDTFKHYCLNTSNEIIDIISSEEPIIEQIGS